MSQTKLRPILIAIASGSLISALLNSFGVFSEWSAVSEHGNDKWLWYSLMLAFPMLGSILGVVISLVGLPFGKTRIIAASVLVFCLSYIAVTILSMNIGNHIRMNGMKQLAKRSSTLVNAIKTYETEHSTPPSKLQDLVPDYIDQIPSTKIGAYPKYDYVSGEPERWDGNPWVLLVSTPSGGINFDSFMYFPKQNYPEAGYGGVLERIEDWAYVHE